LLRTFSLPLVLLLVGYFLQVSQTERDAKLKEDQAERDAKLKVEQDARDSRSQILNTLLPEYSKLVQEHYLTITSRFERVFFETKDYRTNPQNKSQPATASGQSSAPPEPERVLCSILLMRAQIVKLVTEKGGIYFASSVAEDLFFEAFTHFLKRCRDEMGIEDFGAAVELVDAKDTPTIALSKCRDARLFTTILPRFSAWLRTDGFDEYLRLLHISNAVLSFECNRPFYQVGQAVNEPSRCKSWLVCRRFIHEAPTWRGSFTYRKQSWCVRTSVPAFLPARQQTIAGKALHEQLAPSGCPRQ
jgi:hypothetical protein